MYKNLYICLLLNVICKKFSKFEFPALFAAQFACLYVCLSVCGIVSETWLTDGISLDEDLDHLVLAAGLKLFFAKIGLKTPGASPTEASV